MKVYAPGKLVLSGEHAVVYGAPALAMAVNRYVVTSVEPRLLPLVTFELADIPWRGGLPLLALRYLKHRIRQKYGRFVSGEVRIRDVLRKSHELAQFAFTLFVESLNLKLSGGVHIRLQSDIPVGCGMGSSAATILGIAHALVQHLQMKIAPDFFLRIGLEAENMQHGHSSGLDLRICQQGGCLLVHDGEFTVRPVPAMPLYFINTGIPETSTGECVAVAATSFATSHLVDAFADVTHAMDAALSAQSMSGLLDTVRENHQLLSRIGVVPSKVRAFVKEIEQGQGAAKICGAGAVKGDAAGMLLVVTEDLSSLMALCAQYQYALLPVSGEARGVHIV